MKSHKIYLYFLILIISFISIWQLYRNFNWEEIKYKFSPPEEVMIFDEEFLPSDFYNSFHAFASMMTCTYIVESTQARYNVEIDYSTVDFRTNIILELLDNQYIKKLLLDSSSNYDRMYLPYWAYSIVTPNLTSNTNLDKVQKEYGKEKMQELIQFVTKFSHIKPDSMRW